MSFFLRGRGLSNSSGCNAFLFISLFFFCPKCYLRKKKQTNFGFTRVNVSSLSKILLVFVCTLEIDSQLIGAVDGLCYSIAVLQVGRHLKWVDVDVGSLSQRHQLPQSHSEGPLPRQVSTAERLFTNTHQHKPLFTVL